MASTLTDGLGQLAKLPREMRDKIWEKLASSDVKSSAAMLQTSRRVYKELSAPFFRSRTLIFDISDKHVGSALATSFRVFDQEDSSWCKMIHPPYLCVADYEGATNPKMRSWFHANFEKLKGIEVHLEAPRPEEEGDIIAMWARLLWLMSVFKGHTLPDVTIKVLESDRRSWLEDGVYNQSILLPTDGYQWKCPSYVCDLDLLLVPFCRLRNARSVRIAFDPKLPMQERPNEPSGPIARGIQADCIFAINSMKILLQEAGESRLAFGTKDPRANGSTEVGAEYPFKDDVILGMEKTFFIVAEPSS